MYSHEQPNAEAPVLDGPAIRVLDLVKCFGGVRAVDGISFSVAPGRVFGFLGPNGAGKTTTINMLTGLARASSGTTFVAGIDCTRSPKAAQHLMGIVPDDSNLYPELTGFSNLCFCGALYGMHKSERESRAEYLLGLFDLKDAANRKFASYSRGMKRRLTIAAGIMHRPPILFLDEPTTGIDVASARQVRQLIGELNREGTTVFLTTHYIEEAERLCDRIAFMVAGRIVLDDTKDNLMRQGQGQHIVEFAASRFPPEVVAAIPAAFPGTQTEEPSGEVLRVTSGAPFRVGSLVVFLEERGIAVREAREVRPSLEDVFVRVTGLAAREMRREKERGGGSGGGT